MLLTWHFRIDWDVVKWKRGKWEGKIRVPMIFPSTFRSANARFLSPKSYIWWREKYRGKSSSILANEKSFFTYLTCGKSIKLPVWPQVTNQSFFQWSRYNLFNVFSTNVIGNFFFVCAGHSNILRWHEILSTRKGHLLSCWTNMTLGRVFSILPFYTLEYRCGFFGKS